MSTVKDVVVRKPTPQETAQCKKWPIWTCKPSSFDWEYTQIETCLILEGRVTVTDQRAGKDSVSFGPGDLVIFPVGLQCIWTVAEAVRKHYDFSD